MTEVKVERTPKLGSMKETLGFLKEVAKESVIHQAAMTRETTKFMFGTMGKGIRVRNVVGALMKDGEGVISSPDINYNGEKYWVLRFGPNAIRVIPTKNFPTGYTVFTSRNHVLQDMNLSLKICKLYRIWEEFYVRPFKVPRGKKMISWFSSLRERIFEEISKRHSEGYGKLDMDDDEKTALKELDDEVYEFHETDLEVTRLEEKLSDIQISIFEYPSDDNIENMIKIIQRFHELLPIQREYYERRISTWTKYQQLLEKKYTVKIDFKFSSSDLGFAAFVDLMKYVLFKNVIPEGILLGVAWDSTKAIAKAKIAQASLNLIMHYGGLESLKVQYLSLSDIQKKLENYLNAWNTEIPPNMVRLP